MDILGTLEKFGLIAEEQRKLLKNDDGLEKAVVHNGKYALAAMNEGVLFYSQARALVQQVLTQKRTDLVIRQAVAEKDWPLLEQQIAKFTAQQQLPLLAGRYLKPQRPIAHGGYAAVYRSLDVRIHRDVAIKSMLRQDEIAGTRFTLEIEALRRLRHPHVVSLLDVVLEERCLHLVMEYLSGGDFTNRFQAGEIPAHEMITILLQLLSATSYLHGQGKIHRDIKPANILFAKDNHVKLTDFGLIKESQGRFQGLTGEGKVVGTLGYIAPEVLMDGASASPASDVYSIGMIAYQGLYGYHPYCDPCSTPDEIKRAAILQPIKPPSSSLVSRKLGKIVSKALHPDPRQRLTVQAFIDELEKYRGIRACEATAEEVMPLARRRKKIFGIF